VAGTHARPSDGRPRDDGDRAGHAGPAGDAPRHAGPATAESQRVARDYGDIVGARVPAGAPESPPIGFPSALSTGSFRSGQDARARPVPAAPGSRGWEDRDRIGGRSGRCFAGYGGQPRRRVIFGSTRGSAVTVAATRFSKYWISTPSPTLSRAGSQA